MRFEGPVETSELNFRAMPIHDSSLGEMKNFRKEKARYVHRCPFSHCPHDVLGTHVESDPRNFKVSISSMDVPSSNIYVHNWVPLKRGDDLRQSRLVARGTVNPKVTSQYRQRAILYMLNRMKVKRALNEKNQNRLLASLLTLEKKVFDNSDSKEKYMENLATKLFLIFQELEKRRGKSAKGTTPYPDLSLAHHPAASGME